MITRSSQQGEPLKYIPEIEKFARKLTRETKEKKASSVPSEDLEVDIFIADNPLFDEEESMEEVERTLKELAALNVNQQPLCITYPTIDAAFELKYGLIHLLPSFHGFSGEDPHKHLKEFHVVCSSFRPQGVTEDHIKLMAFPFSLKDKAKDWLYYLPEGSITSWDGMRRMFLEKYFPASRAANIRKEICGIRQGSGESLYEYWERFNQLCASCPHHQIPD